MSNTNSQPVPEGHPWHGPWGSDKKSTFNRDLEEAQKRRQEMLKRFREKKQ